MRSVRGRCGGLVLESPPLSPIAPPRLQLSLPKQPLSAPPFGGAPMLGYRSQNKLRSGAEIGRGSVVLRFVSFVSATGPRSLAPLLKEQVPPIGSDALPLGAGRCCRPSASTLSASATSSLPSPSHAAPSLRVGRAKALPPTPRPTTQGAPYGDCVGQWSVLCAAAYVAPTEAAHNTLVQQMRFLRRRKRI